MPISCISCINDNGLILRCLLSRLQPKVECVYLRAGIFTWENINVRIYTSFVLYRKDDRRIRIVQDYDRTDNKHYQPRKATYTEDRWFNPIRVLFGKELSEGNLIQIDAVMVLPISHSIASQILNRLSENTLVHD